MNKCLLVFLLDAFRPDYLAHTRFLRYLAATGVKGRLVEPFGFSARPAYFGGLSPGEAGYSHVFWFDPENSPFRPARYLLPSRTDAGHESTFREAVIRRARTWVTPYAAAYLNTGRIPLDRLHYFDVPERHAPFDPAVGYESVFSLLDRRGMPWYGAFWPLINRLPHATDEEILGAAMAELTPGHRFAFVHLTALDGIGHAFGPSSDEVLQGIDRIDRQVERLVGHCHELYDHVDVVVFGDHGMVNVLQSIDLDARLHQAGLSHGSDYVAFYDSTMARFWCPTAYGQSRLAEVLRRQPGGRLLSAEDKVAWQIDSCDPRNGQLYFLADPGTVIIPNYFQAEGDTVRGMHGYAPEVADNQGVFILNDGQLKGEAGDVHATQLFHTFLDLLGMSELNPKPDRSVRRQVSPPSPDTPRYTAVLRREEEAIIDAHLSALCERINALDPLRDAIVLSGGFGRGEGSVARKDGDIRPLNDYDMLLVTRTPLAPEALRREAKGLAETLGMDFVDIGVMDTASLSGLKPTQLVYDLKYGSRVLAGDPTVLDRFPHFSADAIPVEEGTKLIFNRLAGLLNALPDYGIPPVESGRPREFLAFQLAKLWIAVGDAYLMLWNGYDASYRVRQRRFGDMSASGGVAGEVADAVRLAYDFKLGFNQDFARDIELPLSLVHTALPAVLRHLVAAAYGTGAGQEGSLDGMLDAWIQGGDQPERAVRATWAAVAALVLSHAPTGRDRQLGRAATLLSVSPDMDYQALRRIAWESWEGKCHH